MHTGTGSPVAVHALSKPKPPKRWRCQVLRREGAEVMGGRIGFADDEDCEPEVVVGEGTATYEPTLDGAVNAIARLIELGAVENEVGDIKVKLPAARKYKRAARR